MSCLVFNSTSRCRAASRFCRTGAFPAHRGGTRPRIFDQRLWEPSSSPSLLAPWAQSTRPPNHRVFLKSRGLGGAAGPLHVADEGMGFAVIDGGRPVLCDGRIRRNVDAIDAAAIKVVAILVCEGQEVELACAEVFGTEEAEGACDATAIDWILVRIGEELRHPLDDIGRCGHCPAAALVIRRYEVGFVLVD